MIELKSLCVKYGTESVLKNASARFQKGKLISIVGKNGSGKTTLLSAILGSVSFSDGKILIDGRSSSSLKPKDLAKRIAYLPQGRTVPDMLCGDLVLHGRFPYRSYPMPYTANDRRIAEEAMRSLGILSLRDKPLASLSGGTRQTAYIAMALAQDTDYILFDEPTTYLDAQNELSLMRHLKMLSQLGRGVVAVMHDLPLAFAFSDEIALLNGGRIVMQNTPEALLRSGLIEKCLGVRLLQAENKSYFYDTGSVI